MGENWLLRDYPAQRDVPYPTAEIATRLAAEPPKHLGSLIELTHYLVATRFGIQRETLRAYLKRRKKRPTRRH